MSLETLSKELLNSAKFEEQKYNETYEKETLILDKQSEEDIKAFKEKEQKKLESDITFQEDKILGTYKREAKRVLLEAKAQVLNEVRVQALEQFIDLKGKAREEYFTFLIKKAKEILDFNEVICNTKDESLVKKIAPKQAKISKEANVQGLIFKTANGKQIVDMTFTNLFDEIMDKSKQKVQSILFE